MSRFRILFGTVLLAAALSGAFPATAANDSPAPIVPPPAPPVPSAAAAPAETLDVEAATEAYLATLTPDQRAKSDRYFEKGYWIQLWGFLWTAALATALLFSGVSARFRDLARRITRRLTLQTAIYFVLYCVVVAVASLPWDAYTGYFREHAYGLSNLTLGGWLGESAKALLLTAVFGSLFVVAVYALIRRAPRTWWVWGAIVTTAFFAVMAVIAPVFIEPMFNTSTRLTTPEVRDPILSLARANGIPAHDVWQIDESKQSKRVSAHVTGLMGTERIELNDNLLRRASLPEIEAVMAHEMGHYVLNHVYESVIEFGIVFVLGFLFVSRASARALARWGSRWRVESVGDPASLPLLVALIAAFMFVMTPVANTIIRVNEVEADIFGLNASRQPDGFAQTALKLAEYRKLSPGPIEEFVFYDHPSGRNRILMAMRWKKEHLAALPGAAGVGEPVAPRE